MKILVVTDTHGNQWQLLEWIHKVKPDAVIHCGDVWHLTLEPWPVPIHIIRGNHEEEHFWTDAAMSGPENNIFPHDDYTTFTLGNRKFGVIGRMDWDEGTDDFAKKNLWLGEEHNRSFKKLPLDEATNILAGSEVLLFHEALHPWSGYGFGRPYIGGSPYLTTVAQAVRPKMIFHGHCHKHRVKFHKDLDATVYALAPADPTFTGSYAVLDTETMLVDIWDQAENGK